jgi:chemotaxis protein CheZ
MNPILNAGGYNAGRERASMAAQRKVFRIEESMRGAPARADAAAVGALRALLEPRPPANREALERARAQLAEMEAFRSELGLVHAAIADSRPVMEALDRSVPRGQQLTRTTRELEAVVAGTERAAQAILTAAEMIEESAQALGSAADETDRLKVAIEISQRVAQIFQACDFQDITGQRVVNVLATFQQVEAQIAQLMQVWQRLGQIQPVVFDQPDAGDQQFLNGPRLEGDAGHSSQDEIDAMFGWPEPA